uniref:CCDC174 alpha/beta GRSR domain-containing protein n=1 Tax=Rhodnius prolixus TaxID=13249 RepID=T1HRW0_RHOPR
MRSGKLIDISRSSLISLKAELSRKQEEIQKVKEQASYTKLPPKPKKEIKANPGVDQRNEKDIALTEEEVDLLKKSREVLEIKASIYDKYQKGELVSKDGKSHYLVDFGRKTSELSSPVQADVEVPTTVFADTHNETAQKTTDASDDPVEDFDLEDEEWIEYVDCLGRTRTCHRSDLTLMKDRDKSLAVQLNVEKNELKQTAENNKESVDLTVEKELLSRDMHLEEMRQKWEEQEKNLASKQDIHYEDVLFDGKLLSYYFKFFLLLRLFYYYYFP